MADTITQTSTISMEIINSEQYKRANIRFSGIPSEEVRTELKNEGWLYSRNHNVWYPRNIAAENSMAFAKHIKQTYFPEPQEEVNIVTEASEQNELAQMVQNGSTLKEILEKLSDMYGENAVSEAFASSKEQLENQIAFELPPSEQPHFETFATPIPEAVQENMAEVRKEIEETEPSFYINGTTYTQNEIESLLQEDLQMIFRELLPEPYIEGVRLYKNPEKDGKISLLVQYGTNDTEGFWREDALFDALIDEHLTFNGMTVDVNPITPTKSGTIEEYLARLERLDATSEEEAIEKQAEMIAEKEDEELSENESEEAQEEESEKTEQSESEEELPKRNIFTFEPFGYEGAVVSVETDLRRGIPAYDIVGISDGMVKETREVIKAAFRNSGLELPAERILQSLSPADLRKESRGTQLAMALSILSEQNGYKGENVLVLGELELSGKVRPVRAVHAAVESARAMGIYNVIVPEENVAEAQEVPGMKVMGIPSLSDAHEKLLHKAQFTENRNSSSPEQGKIKFNEELLSEVYDMNLDGYYDAARAIEIAIAGKHNILLEGAPGCGKTLLSTRLIPALTPELTVEESQTVTRIHSLAGLMRPNDGLIRTAPFRMPHQTASIEGICGGGARCNPGEISLAHNGTLFLDEAAEFRSSVLQMLRVPLESKSITLSRAGRTTCYPANFQLVMATNPCPCGNYGNTDKICLCSQRSIEQYWKKFSDPLLDRVEIKQNVRKDENDRRRISVPEMKQHIENAFRIQRENPHYNASLNPQEIAELCKLDEECQTYLNDRIQKYDLSPRSQANTLKVALTIANMEGRTEIAIDDLREAVELNAPIFEKPNQFKRDQSNVSFAGFNFNSYYHSTHTRDICHDIKQTESAEARAKAITEMAAYLGEQIKNLNSPLYLVPAPQHTGNAEYTLEIANQMAAANPNCKVLDILKCEPHETLYEQKKNGNRQGELNFYLVDGAEIPENARLFLVDNVISSGNTFNEANKLFNGNLFPLVYSVSDFAKLEMKNGKVVITDTRNPAAEKSAEVETSNISNDVSKNSINTSEENNTSNGLSEVVIDLSAKKTEPLQLTEEDLDICKMVIPSEQYKFTIELTQGEEGEFFKQKLKDIADTFRKINTDEELRNENDTHNVGFRYFLGDTEIYISQIYTDGIGFGYTILNGDLEMSEWGDSSIEEIISIPFIEMDYHVPKDATIEQMLHNRHPDYFPAPETATEVEATVESGSNERQEESENPRELKPNYHFYVRDTTEFEAFQRIDPITNLSAKEAVEKFLSFDNGENFTGIGIIVPGSIDHGEEFEGSGVVELYSRDGQYIIDDIFMDSHHDIRKNPDYVTAVNALISEMNGHGKNVYVVAQENYEKLTLPTTDIEQTTTESNIPKTAPTEISEEIAKNNPESASSDISIREEFPKGIYYNDMESHVSEKRKEEIRYEMSELASKNGYALSYDTLSRYVDEFEKAVNGQDWETIYRISYDLTNLNFHTEESWLCEYKFEEYRKSIAKEFGREYMPKKESPESKLLPEEEPKNEPLTKGEIKSIREQCREILRKPDGEITEEDKAILAQYEGAGGLDEKDRSNSGVLNEFYTPRNLVAKAWEIADNYAPNAVSVLEPSSGTGRFADGRPNNTFTMHEKDEVSARINKILHPNANIIEGAFQKQFFDENERFKKIGYQLPKYDLVIGNPPYGTYNDKYKGLGEGKDFDRYEEYFIQKGLESLKDENSLLVFVVPSGFLRTVADKPKTAIALTGELIDAYRLPEGTFPTTQVGTDIIVLKKYNQIDYAKQLENAGVDSFTAVNLAIEKTHKNMDLLQGDEWFKQHPEKVLGEIKERTNRFGDKENYVTPHDGLTIQDELDKITGLLPAETESQTVNEEVSNLESINKQAETLGYYFEYDNRENIVDIYENESGNLIGSLDSEGNFGFTDDFEGQLPNEVSQLASRFLELSKTSKTEEHVAEKETPVESENKNPLVIPEDEVRKIYKEAYPKNQERAAKEAEKFIEAWKAKAFNGLTSGLIYTYPETPKLRELFNKTENVTLPDDHTESLIWLSKYADYDTVPQQFKFKNWNDAIRYEILNGTGIEEGKKRVYEFFRKNLSNAERAKFLKDEYGIGGYGGSGYNQDHDSKGIKLKVIIKDKEQTRLFSWSEVADAISLLVMDGEYYKPATKEESKQNSTQTETRVESDKTYNIPQKAGVMTAQEFSKLYGKSFDDLSYSVWKHADWEGYIKQEELSEDEKAYIGKSNDYVQEKPGIWTHKVLFESGDIYKKIDEQEKLLSSANFNEDKEAAELHKKNIEALKAARKTPVKLDDIHIALNSTLAEEFTIPHTYESGLVEERNLAESFILWAQGETVDSQRSRHSMDYSTARIAREDLPDNVSWWDIVDFIDGKKVVADKTSSWSYGKTEDEIKHLRKERKKQADEKRMARQETANKLFDRYMHEGLDDKTRERFLAEYNRRFNSYVIPKYENLPLYIDGMNAYKGKTAFKLYDQQLKGVARLSAKGNGLLAYDVGVGKTATGIVANINQIQTGRSKRPLILVPNAVYSKWVTDIKQLFPNLKVNELYNFSDDHIKKFRDSEDNHKLNIPASSISVCTYEALKHITFTDKSCCGELFEDFSKLLSADFDGSANENAAMGEKIMGTIGTASCVNDANYVFFEKCGFDNITVDEAHNFKNLWVAPKPKNKGDANEYSGIPSGQPSKRAIKLFAMTQLVQRHNDNRNVFLLTATPFTNSPVEVYSMLTYIGRERLVASGIYSLRDFMNQFAHTKLELGVNTKGEIDYRQVMKDWKELPALQNLLTEFIDKVDGEEAGIIRPKKFSHVKELDLSPLQKKIIEAEEERMMNVTENSGAILEAMNNMRVALVSPALLNKFKYDDIEIPELKDLVESSPKLKFVCDAIVDMYKEHPDMGQFMYMPLGKEGHGIVADYLEEHGIPGKAIKIINGEVNNTPEKKEKITAEFNDPKNPLKIIIGGKNTSEGIDLNGNSFVMYNCSLGWNPSETIQAEGRIWRQGNMQGHVHIVYPVMTDSIDSLLYQKHDEKRSRINDLWTYKGNMLNVEDINPEELKFDLIKDPNKRVKLILDEETKDLKAKLSKVNLRQESFDEILERRKAVLEALEQSEKDFVEHTEWKNEVMAKGERVPNYMLESLRDDKKNIETYSRQRDVIAEKFAGMNLHTEEEIFDFVHVLNEEKHEVEAEIEKAKEKLPALLKEMKTKLAEQKLVAHPIEQQRHELEATILGNLRPMKDIIDEMKKDSGAKIEKADEPYVDAKGDYYLFDLDDLDGKVSDKAPAYDNGKTDDLAITPAQIKESEAERNKICRPVMNGEKSGLWTAFKDFEEKGVFDIQGKKVSLTPTGRISKTGWNQLQAAMSIYRSKKFETFRYVLIDRYNGEIRDQIAVSSHMPNTTIISDPNNQTLKQVISRAEEKDCLVIAVHNHPSGNTTPSDYDIKSTKALEESMKRKDGFNRFAGHIILDHDSFALYKPHSGWLQKEVKGAAQTKDELIKDSVPEWAEGKVKSNVDLVLVAETLNAKDNWNDDYVPVLFTDSDYNISGLNYVHKDLFLEKSEQVRKELQDTAHSAGAVAAFPIFTEPFLGSLSEKERSKFEQMLKSHVENKAFTDAAIGTSVVSSKFGIKPGESYCDSFFAKAKDSVEVKATWNPTVNPNIFVTKTDEKHRRAAESDIER